MKALVIALLILLTGCAVSPTGRQQLLIMPEGELIQMGHQAFLQMKRRFPLSRDPRRNRRVRCVVSALARVVGGRWEVAVFDVDEVNAFALPGGKIGVYRGIFRVAQTPDELAAVLAHEIAHVIAHHHNERLSQQFAAESALNLIQAIAAPESQMGQLAMAALGLGVQVGILMPYSRLQEQEADLVGLELMARAGFDPRAALTLWRQMIRLQKRSPPEWLSTHPSGPRRLRTLAQHLPQVMPLYREALKRGFQNRCP